MILTEDRIQFVKIICRPDGKAYHYYVSLGRISDNRCYHSNNDGIATEDYYPFVNLPRSVQNFIFKHRVNLWDDCEGYKTYILSRED